MTTTITPLPATDPTSLTYEEVRLLIWDTVHKFKAKYKGDLEDLFAQANLHFMRAYNSYKPNKKQKFSSWVRYIVWMQLLETKRSLARAARRGRIPMQLEEEYDVAVETGNYVDRVHADLSRDAQFVLKLILTPPNEKLKKRLYGRTGHSHILSEVQDYLKDSWTEEQIKTIFKELAEAV